MPRRLLTAAALATAFVAAAAAPPALDAELAWKGWVRPGQVLEVEVRVAATEPLRATVEVQGAAQRAQAVLDLQPGRAQRLHLPVPAPASGPVRVVLSAPGGVDVQRELTPVPSESPLFGVALAVPASVALEGFHTVALTSADLPRTAAAYASADALLLDAATLAGLDAAQLSALLAHIAGCGRVAVLQADSRVRGLLDGARGCGGAALVHAATAEQAQQRLQAALSEPLAPALTRGSLGDLARPTLADWDRVALALATTGALLVLGWIFSVSLPVLLGLPALAALALLGLLQLAQPAPQLLIWSEADSGAQLARFQAWQRVPGLARGSVRVPLPAQLAAGTQPCDRGLQVRWEIDPARGMPTFAEFETRLFRQVWLCHGGAFPMARAFDTDMLAGGMRQVRNTGTAAWPAGLLLVGGQAQPLPALGAGGAARVPVATVPTADDAAARVAATRLPHGAAAALWPLELAGVAGAPSDARGWLLVTAGAAP